MDSSKPQGTEPNSDVDALETAEPAGSSAAAATSGSSASPPPAPTPAAEPPKKGGLKDKLRVFNFYLLIFAFILMVAGVILVIAYFQSKKATTNTIKSQTLTQNTLQQLANSDATVGDPKQVLNVQSNAVFAGKVLVRSSLEVAGGIQVGGTVTLSALTVTGQGSFDQLQVNKNLTIGGDTAIQGAATVQKSLQVNGNGTFSGSLSAPQLTVSNLQLNGDLVLTHHITAGGPTPNRVNGPALGSGGTASVNGSDTSGTVSINTGSGPAAGCFVTVNFASKYASTPHVTITPVGSAGGGLAYYVERSTGSFSICDASAPPAGVSFAFDYFIVD